MVSLLPFSHTHSEELRAACLAKNHQNASYVVCPWLPGLLS